MLRLRRCVDDASPVTVTVLPDGTCDGAPGVVLRATDLASPPAEGQAVVLACLPIRPGPSSACVLGVRVSACTHCVLGGVCGDGREMLVCVLGMLVCVRLYLWGCPRVS